MQATVIVCKVSERESGAVLRDSVGTVMLQVPLELSKHDGVITPVLFLVVRSLN